MATPELVELDGRRRASLGKIGRHDRYLVYEQGDGVLVFEPAVLLTAAEAALLANPALVAQIADNRAHPERRRPRTRRS